MDKRTIAEKFGSKDKVNKIILYNFIIRWLKKLLKQRNMIT